MNQIRSKKKNDDDNKNVNDSKDWKLSKLNTLLRNEKQILFFILALTTILYLPVFYNQILNFDDFHYVTINPYIRHFKFANIKAIFTSYYMGNYHPLSMLCYMIAYAIGKESPWVYQVMNLSLHLVNTVLVFYFIKAVSKKVLKEKASPVIPFITALLFGIHTIHVESVAWISENKNVLYTLFFLSSLILYVKFLDTCKRKNYYLALLLFCISLFSKGVAVTLPPILLLIDYVWERKIFSVKVIFEKIPFFILSLIFGIVAFFAQGTALNSVTLLRKAGIYDKISIASHGLIQYINKLILPIRLSPLYEYIPGTSTVLPFPFYIYPGLVIAGFILLFRIVSRNRVYLFGAFFFLINIALLLQLIPVGQAVMADRYVYVPSIGFFFILAYLINWIAERKIEYGKIVLYCFSAYIIALSTLTFRQISIWKDSKTFWHTVLSRSGNHPKSRAWVMISGMYNDDGKYEEANKFLTQYIKDNPLNVTAYYQRAFARYHLNDTLGAKEDLYKSEKISNIYDEELTYNWGILKNKFGDYKGAVDCFNKSIKINPNTYRVYNGRAEAKIELGDYNGALFDLKRSIDLNSLNPELSGTAYYLKALTRYHMNDFRGAREDLKKSEEITVTDNEELINNWGVLRNKLGDYQEALDCFNKAIKIDSTNANFFNGRADVELILDNYKSALQDLTRSIELNPLTPEVYNNRGIVNSKLGQYKESIADFNEAIKLKKDFLEAYQNRIDVMFLLNDYNGAMHDLNYVILQGEIPYAYYLRGKANMKLNRKTEACNDFNKAINLGYVLVDKELSVYCGKR